MTTVAQWHYPRSRDAERCAEMIRGNQDSFSFFSSPEGSGKTAFLIQDLLPALGQAETAAVEQGRSRRAGRAIYVNLHDVDDSEDPYSALYSRLIELTEASKSWFKRVIAGFTTPIKKVEVEGGPEKVGLGVEFADESRPAGQISPRQAVRQALASTGTDIYVLVDNADRLIRGTPASELALKRLSAALTQGMQPGAKGRVHMVMVFKEFAAMTSFRRALGPNFENSVPLFYHGLPRLGDGFLESLAHGYHQRTSRILPIQDLRKVFEEMNFNPGAMVSLLNSMAAHSATSVIQIRDAAVRSQLRRPGLSDLFVKMSPVARSILIAVAEERMLDQDWHLDRLEELSGEEVPAARLEAEVRNLRRLMILEEVGGLNTVCFAKSEDLGYIATSGKLVHQQLRRAESHFRETGAAAVASHLDPAMD